MGWRDRDYAKWTDEDRSLYYGSGGASRGFDPLPRGVRNRLRPGAWLAVLVTLVIALGQLPLHHPLIPALNIGGATATPTPTVGTIRGLSTATVGSSLTLDGPAPTGAVTVQGSYDGGRTWTTLSSVESIGGAYTTTLQLTQRGDLSLKVTYADGSTATGSVVVQ